MSAREGQEAEVAAAQEPHVPAPGERAARDGVCAEATGLAHHEAHEALEAAREAGADPAVVAEWQRITEHLEAHGGPYTPESDPFAQGRRAARAHHAEGAQAP
ncbi:hypothetical protein [Streptomyces sp. Isolate_45]|uniref:hypothetical protein n=1 Tax=unclassified Streptomyces TaxID=2593676 RepID=UPI002481D2F1|nr:hypothetical protein [Streptomyces sp. Isolate_45]MDA5284351.1 hypothetical protein [Streptomyces sp. Isolate_45]